MSTYQPACLSLGYDVDSCIYDVIRKVSLRPLKATPEASRKYTAGGLLYKTQRENDETFEEFRERVRAAIEAAPDKYFARGPIVRLEQDAAEHATDVWQTASQLRESENANAFPRSPNACERWGRMCDYFEVCSGAASIDDEVRFRTAEHAHEELAAVKEI